MQYNFLQQLFNLIFLALIMMLSFTAQAQEGTPEEAHLPSTTSLLLRVVIDINSKSLSSETIESLVRIDRESAIDEHSNLRISFSKSMQKMDILSAYTLTPKGKKIPVALNSIKIQDHAVSAHNAEFSDSKVKVVIYPEVNIGSAVYIKYRKTNLKSPLPGHDFHDYNFHPSSIIKDAKISITHSNKIKLYLDTPQLVGGSVKAPKGKVRYEYSYQQLKNLELEPGTVDYEDFAAGYFVSTIKDPMELGRIYQHHATPRMTITPEIQNLAKKITLGLTNRRDKINALFTWVSLNIRYVSDVVERGGLIPHSAAQILAVRYGDCKDHSTIMSTLLNAVGIDNTPALINLGNSYQIRSVGTVAPFNHVITYIPSEDIYIDSTSRVNRPGLLPSDLLGKPVIWTKLAKLGTTPTPKAFDSLIKSSVVLVVDPNGEVSGEATDAYWGRAEWNMRDWAASSRNYSVARNVRTILSDQGDIGSGEYTFDDPYKVSPGFEFKSKYTLQPNTNFPGPGGWRIPIGLASAEMVAFAENNLLVNRTQAWKCLAATYQNHYTIQFPDNVKLTHIPQNVAFNGDAFQYQATYAQIGNTVTVSRTLIRDYQKAICAPSDWGERKVIDLVVKRDLRSQIIYE